MSNSRHPILLVCLIILKTDLIDINVPGVSIKSWHFWIVCQLKTVKQFWTIFINMYCWKCNLSYNTKQIWKYLMLELVLATFVKGMKIRLRKSRLSVLAEWKVPQRRNCWWCDEFMINSDGYWLYCVWHGLFIKQKFMNKWTWIKILITNGLWKSC